MKKEWTRNIIMNITNLHSFLRTYFSAYNCPIEHDEDGILTVQLTKEMDQSLMNRPFYWHYMKSIGHDGDPAQLTFITQPGHDQGDENGEWIHFGSPRLQQIFNHLRQTSDHVKLFQKINTTKNTALYPWLLTNIKISYKGKQNKDELFSIGLNLINGMMKTNMMELLQELPLQNTISDYCFPMSPLIKLKSGFIRITAVIEDYLKNQTYDWADESLLTLSDEINMVQHFYEDEEDNEHLQKEIDELTNLYQPTITYQVINGGLIYLFEDVHLN